MGAAEVLEQLLVGVGLFDRVQLGAVEVLQERVQEHLLVVGIPDDRRDPLKARFLGRPQTPLTHDQLIAVAIGLAHDHGLEEADLLDGDDEFRQGVLVEDLTRLVPVGNDGVERKLGEVGTRRGLRPDRRLGVVP